MESVHVCGLALRRPSQAEWLGTSAMGQVSRGLACATQTDTWEKDRFIGAMKGFASSMVDPESGAKMKIPRPCTGR